MGTNSNNTHFNLIGIKNQILKKKKTKKQRNKKSNIEKKKTKKQKGSRCEN